MTLGTHDAVMPQDPADAVRSRDAVKTRGLLLEAARRRFAHDGYGATTSRDIAADVGVNVALINRYFSSKEGLFEACLERTVKELDDADIREISSEDLVQAMVERIAMPSGDAHPLQLLLLLRASGDERAEAIRRRRMQSFTERMATIAGWRPDDARTAPILLRAQIAMAMGLGVVVMRNSSDLEPLASASVEELDAPLRAAFESLLPALPNAR